MPLTSMDLLSLWYRALQAEIGIGIRTDDRRYLQSELYKARAASGDPELEKLVMMMPNNNEVWLCKRAVEL